MSIHRLQVSSLYPSAQAPRCTAAILPCQWLGSSIAPSSLGIVACYDRAGRVGPAQFCYLSSPSFLRSIAVRNANSWPQGACPDSMFYRSVGVECELVGSGERERERNEREDERLSFTRSLDFFSSTDKRGPQSGREREGEKES